MRFWLKHIIALALILLLAVILLVFPEWLMPKSDPIQVDIKKSAAAMEFTNFYERLRYSLDTSVDASKEFIIELTDTSDELTNNLEKRTGTVPPLPANWNGESKNRKFEPGSKIREHMGAFAKEEQMELIWTLPRDYVVKHYFQSSGNYLTTLKAVAKAISPDFETPVLVYFCPKQSAAVITDHPNEFLEKNCQFLNPQATRN